MQSPDVECVHLTQPFHMRSPLDISHTGASTVDSGRDPVLSQRVSGELVSSVTCEECAVKYVLCLLCRPSIPPQTLQKVCEQKSCNKGEGSP